MSKIKIARKLLGQGAGSLRAFSRLQIGKHSPRHSLQVKAGMIIKFTVLDRQGSLNKLRGYLA
ncbi:hypothetical protein D3C81_2004460 [compost metagenome]